MIATMYLILFLISVLYLFVLLYKFGNKHISVYYFLLSICIILINFGYWQCSIADTVEAAIIANKVSYLGSSFVAVFMICCISQLTKIRIPAVIQWMYIGAASVIAIMAMTIGHSDLYYKSVSLVTVNGYSYLDKEYGPMHILFILLIVLSMCHGLIMIAVAFTRQKKVSYISCICSLAVMMSVTVVYFVKTGIYSLLPFAYDFGFAIILLLMTRIYLYNTVALSEVALDDSGEYGFVAFDSKRRFLGADSMARKWFPELNDLKIDYTILEYSTDFLRQIKEWICENEGDKIQFFTCGKQIVKAKFIVLSKNRKRKVFCIRLRDDTKQQEYNRLIENYNRDLQENVDLKTKRIEQIQNDITIGMASIVENRDSNTGGHIRRTSDIVRVFVNKLTAENKLPGLDSNTAECITRAAPLHDFGKIAISDAILNKPGKYTPEEFEVMKAHPVFGAAIVERILQSAEDATFKRIAKNIANYHHEKWDGSGYPEGLKGEEIPLEARVMALADVFDALVSKRVYKEPYSFERAFSIIKDESGRHFDPLLCEHFLNCRDELISVYSANAD